MSIFTPPKRNSLSSRNNWVNSEGHLSIETESQRTLAETPFFQLSLRIYRRDRIQTLQDSLNEQMQTAYEQDMQQPHTTTP